MCQENDIIPEGSTIVVGDIHGKLDIVVYALSLSDQYKVVFLGDFLDSFDKSIDDQIDCLTLVLDKVQYNPNVIALLGNHELSYIYNGKYICSGYNAALNIRLMGDLLRNAEKHLLRCTIVDDWLLTHAGVSKHWFDQHKNKCDVYEIETYINTIPLYQFTHVGYLRGGYGTGGPVWCDWDEFVPIDGIKQVFGHTAYGGDAGIRNKGDNYIIDVLDYRNEFLVLLPNGRTQIHTFTTKG